MFERSRKCERVVVVVGVVVVAIVVVAGVVVAKEISGVGGIHVF